MLRCQCMERVRPSRCGAMGFCWVRCWTGLRVIVEEIDADAAGRRKKIDIDRSRIRSFACCFCMRFAIVSS